MRLIMAVSADGYLARGPDDDMSWTGRADKKVFQLLTNVGGVCAAGSRTYDLISGLAFPGRTLLRLSRRPLELHLDAFAGTYPDAWLLGGPTIAREALMHGHVEEIHLCINTEMLGGGMSLTEYLWPCITGVKFPIVSTIEMLGGLVCVQTRRRI